MSSYQFDQIDRDILERLQRDGRVSIKRLSQEVHLSAPAVGERVRRLESLGVIEGYTLRVNPGAMGFQIRATIIVMLQSGRKDAFLQFIQNEPEIAEADELPGKTDAILRVYCTTAERFFALVSRIREYGATDSYIHMEHYKHIPLLPEADAAP